MGFLGVLFFAVGLVCIVLGSMIVDRYYRHLSGLSDTDIIVIPAIILIVVGFVLFFAGISGFCNTCRENKCCLGSFFAFLLLVFILMITAVSLSSVYREEINSSLEATLNKTIYKYNESDPTTTKQMDDMQQAFKCCGVNSSDDWKNTPYGTRHVISYPNSCKVDPNAVQPYPDGCYLKIKSFFDSNFAYIIGGTVGLLVILAIGMAGSCALIYYRRNEEKYFTLS